MRNYIMKKTLKKITNKGKSVAKAGRSLLKNPLKARQARKKERYIAKEKAIRNREIETEYAKTEREYKQHNEQQDYKLADQEIMKFAMQESKVQFDVDLAKREQQFENDMDQAIRNSLNHALNHITDNTLRGKRENSNHNPRTLETIYEE